MKTAAVSRHFWSDEKRYPLIFAAIVSILFAIGCSQAEFGKAPEPIGDTNGIGGPGDPPAVCGPYPGGGSGGAQYGLKGTLHYLGSNQPTYYLAADYIKHGQKVPNPLYLNELFVPTYRFENGFKLSNGDFLKKQNGERLTAFFGFRVESNIQLAAGDDPGAYQLAFISDDGATLTINENGTVTKLIDNDGYHPSQMKCANRAVHLSPTTRIPIRVDYFQGPPTHIALIMMWRKMPSSTDDLDNSFCYGNLNSDELFFDYTQSPPAPLEAYNYLLSKGWKPLRPQNYILPEGNTNPCF